MGRLQRRALVSRLVPNHHELIRHRPQLERLEPRNLLTSLPVSADGSLLSRLLSSHGDAVSCPIWTDTGLSDLLKQVEQGDDSLGGSGDSGGSDGSLPQGTLPLLTSRPNATAKLFLDFDGHFQASWGGWSNVNTPVYDTDGNFASFSTAEQNAIAEIWQRVAEDYAPFNIDVTTIAPGSQANGVVAHIAIGGNWSDWYGSSAGGVAYVGGFYNSSPNVGYVFEDAMANGNAKFTAEAASHEAGHLFGMTHQAKWNGSTLVESYHSGSGDWAPIMGVGYYVTRTTWHNGATAAGPTAFQDDLAILSGASNGFGYAADDYGSTLATASNLPITGTSVLVSGLVGRTVDQDYFSFTTGGGTVNFTLAVDAYGPNLDAVLELRDSGGAILATAAPGESYGASLSYTAGAGTFYLVARGMGDYGDMGRYKITGTVPAAVPAPEITLRIGTMALTDGQTIDFGSTNVGTSVDRTFTVVNDGNATLTLTSLNPASLPAGFTLVSNLGSTTLAAGASTTFTLRFSPTAGGDYSGSIALVSDDANENPFDLVLDGFGVAQAPEITVLLDTAVLSSGGTLAFGETAAGTPVTRTLTIRNDGTQTLNLTALDPASLPAGYSIVSNIGTTTLAPGAYTTLTLRLDASAAGSFTGSISIASTDSDENPFVLNLTGTVNAAFVPYKEIIDNGDAGWAVTGTWTRTTGKGYESDIHTTAKGNGTKYVTWTFNGVPDGQYNIWGTWAAAKTNATNAPFQFYNGSGNITTVKINQRVAPAAVADGFKWTFLGKVVANNGWVMVKLANNANGVVVADAIRIVQLPPAASTAADSPGSGARQAGLGSLLVFASALHDDDGHVHGLPVPARPAPAAQPSAIRSQPSHDLVFSRDEDVRPESALLEEAVNLLGALSSASSEESSELAVDHLLAAM
jgi:hypothetical protein